MGIWFSELMRFCGRWLLYAFTGVFVVVVLAFFTVVSLPFAMLAVLHRPLRYTLFTTHEADQERLETNVLRPLRAYVEDLTSARDLPASYVEELHGLIDVTFLMSRIVQVGESAAIQHNLQIDKIFIQHQTHMDLPRIAEEKAAKIGQLYSLSMSCSWYLWFASIVYADLVYHHVPELFHRVCLMSNLNSAFTYFVAHWMSVSTTGVQALFPCYSMASDLNLWLIKCYIACDADFQQPTVPPSKRTNA